MEVSALPAAGQPEAHGGSRASAVHGGFATGDGSESSVALPSVDTCQRLALISIVSTSPPVGFTTNSSTMARERGLLPEAWT